MIKYHTALLSITALLAAVASHGMDRTGRAQLIEKLIRVESNGKANLIGDQGKAYGILQIHAEMIIDANRIAGTHYSHEDAFDPIKAREIASIVLSHYDSHIARTSGHEATAKELAFIWNGGGSSWKRVEAPKNDSKQKNLERYWSKVSTR